MNFIEISPGKNLRKSEIIDVSYVDDMTCKIATQIGVYDCVYPSWRILMLLEQPTIEEQIAMQPSDNPDYSTRNLWGHQHWAG
jgi:hypothetical protein